MTAAVGVTGRGRGVVVYVYVYVVSLSVEQHTRHTAIGRPMMQPRPTKPKEIDNPKILLPREGVKCY